MYQVLNPRELLRLRGRRVGPKVARNVLLLGLVSLFTDVSSEIVTTILPLYLVYTLGFSPLQFGIVDGLQQGAAALVRVAGGFAADRTRRHKEVAIVGYGLSTFARLGLLATNSLQALSAIVFLDRTGKGIRTAPRDALISLSSDRDALGTAFGVHRALDTAGAMIGPLLAFGLLWLNPGEFDPIFVASFCFGLIGLALLVLFVENRPVPVADAAHVSLRAAFKLLSRPQFATLALVGGALAVFTISDGFLFLALQRHLDFQQRLLPILFVGTAGVFMLLAIPVGRLADRVGRGRVFLAGYVPLVAAYLLLLVPGFGSLEIALFLLLLGAYYAATDGVLMALASTTLPAALRGSGLALLVTATSLGRLLASIVFGTIWTWQNVDTAIAAFAIGLLVAMAVAATALRLAPEVATAD
ncbi:MAG TPA: MFS transporter [Gaiellaceae bacterium]|nr:MFS transporter [Gaiellaceae bacterium]